MQISCIYFPFAYLSHTQARHAEVLLGFPDLIKTAVLSELRMDLIITRGEPRGAVLLDEILPFAVLIKPVLEGLVLDAGVSAGVTAAQGTKLRDHIALPDVERDDVSLERGYVLRSCLVVDLAAGAEERSKCLDCGSEISLSR
jgi:hypothetical protein